MHNIIPKGWQESTLEEKFSIQIGGTPSRANALYWDRSNCGANLWVSIRDLKSKYIFDTAEKISELGVEKSNVKLVPKNTVIMSFKLTVGRLAITGKPLYTNEAIAAFVPKNQMLVDNNFLYHGLNYWNLEGEVDQAIKGKTLNKEKIKRIVGLFPPFAEQKRIASILESVDDVDELLKAKIAKLENLKKAMMNQLLSKGIGHRQFKNTKLGVIPEAWDVGVLSSYCRRVCVGFVGTCEPFYRPQGIPLIRTGNLKNGHLDLSTMKFVTKEFHESQRKSQLEVGDLLIARHGDFGQACLVTDSLGEANCLNIVIVKPNFDCLYPQFLKYLFNTDVMRARFESRAEGSTQKVISTTEIGNTVIIKPPIAEQIEIAEILKNFDESIELSKSQLKKNQMLKTGLMQDLLTGKVRVPVN
jgi:type I restriction enzyme S subunit